MEKELKRLKKVAVEMRRDIINMAAHCGTAIHVGPALSCTDMMAALYFKIMNIDPENPTWDERDRFVMSKGHAYAALYSALAERGFFPREELLTARGINSRLQGHPALGKTPGVDMTAGSLGNGFACALGIAKALKLKGSHAHVYAMLGDGESQEGVIWEAALAAPNFGCDNLTAIVDYNHFQSCGAVKDIMPMYPMADKWKAFGWEVWEMNGNDMADVVKTLDMAKEYDERPVCIIANTVKGKGISFTEHNNRWHAAVATEEEYVQAMKELDDQLAAIDAGEM